MAAEVTKAMNSRMRGFAVRVIELAQEIPKTQAGRTVSGQLIRSASSAGANYRASQRPRSAPDMIAKLKIVEEEFDESMYWMELIIELKLLEKAVVKPHYQEANELLSITVASINSLRNKSSRVREQAAEYGTNGKLEVFD
jgi:four helix bundle protein